MGSRRQHDSLIRVVVLTTVTSLMAPVALAALLSGPTAGADGAPSARARQEIPADLLPVYRSAALTCPGLPWQVLAGIEWVESGHGRGRVDPETGDVRPPIVGPPIDGRPGFARIPDPTQPDGWAHALGPMQFLSSTWSRWATLAPDRPPGTEPDVHNAWDAIYTAARMLCGGRPEVTDLRAALFSYNRSETYVEEVLAKAEEYGLGASPAEEALLPGSGEAVVLAAMTQLGVPYVWGGASPSVGFDCSGLVQWAYAQIGVALPRTTAEQVLVGVPVDVDDLRPGDLVFSLSVRAGGQRVDRGHVAIYAGGGQVLVAPRTGDDVMVRPLVASAMQAARRIV
ncbi:MAG: C40 family peptidase [Actinobacteria bacterium]|nr:C40 family peptidase [Actinomycetota bacterium]